MHDDVLTSTAVTDTINQAVKSILAIELRYLSQTKLAHHSPMLYYSTSRPTIALSVIQELEEESREV